MEIAFAADKGGVGKTTLAYHVATRLRQLGHDVGLVDLDRRAAACWWVGRAAEPYFPAYSLTDLAQTLPHHACRIWDTPAHIGADVQDRLAAICDLVAVVTTQDAVSFLAAAELCRSLQSRHAAVGVLVNQVHPSSREDLLAPFAELGVHRFQTAVRRYSCYVHAQWDGRAVCDGPYGSADPAWADICALTAEILAQVELRHAA